MRIRLQLLLPPVLVVVVAAGFLAAALAVGGAIRSAPGDDAAAAAIRVIVIWGILSTVAAAFAGAVIARLIAKPLARMRDAAQGLTAAREPVRPGTPLAEVQDAIRGIERASGEIRERHGRETRERSELAALVDAVSEGILQLDPYGRIVRINGAGSRLLGLPADPEGQTVASLVRNAELRRSMIHAAAGRDFEAIEVALDERRVLASMAPLPGGGAVATLVDLTDLRRLEEVRRDFVANASHELKTPLTSIRGYAETLLAGDPPDPERRQFLEVIARNAGRLQRIVDDLLDLSRLESGHWRPELETIDVADVAEKAWVGFEERGRERGIAFVLEAVDDPAATADGGALEQVFGNLYDNALRHTADEGGGSILVRIRREVAGPDALRDGSRSDPASSPDPPPWLVVEVADTGSGIPRDALPRIFERFYRADPARSRVEGGTGLGLSIVRHMMESMGGAVAAESALGKGTTIRLWLPAA